MFAPISEIAITSWVASTMGIAVIGLAAVLVTYFFLKKRK